MNNQNWSMLGAQQEQANQFGNLLSGLFGNLGHLGTYSSGAGQSTWCGGPGPDPHEWNDWCLHYPPHDKLIQWIREGDLLENAQTGYVGEVSPYMNISGLYWRFTGISKHWDEEKWWPESVKMTKIMTWEEAVEWAKNFDKTVVGEHNPTMTDRVRAAKKESR